MNQTYRATTEADGTLIVHAVPIFVECERERGSGEVFQFDREWITVAVHKAKQAEAEGSLPPLHIRHHDPETDDVRASGFFRIVGTTEIRFKGETRVAILADLHITDPRTREDVMAKRLPYRSVEIFNVEKPSIDSLALLDHEPPFLELPMLMVSGVGTVASATFKARSSGQQPSDATIRAAMHDANGIAFQEPMDDEKKKPDAEPEDKPEVAMEGIEEGKEPAVATEAESGVDWDAALQAIEDGSVTVSVMEAIVEKIKARTAPAQAEGETMEDQKPDQVDGPAPMDERMSKLTTENEVLRAELESLKLERATEADVGAAMSRLHGRPLGSDIKERLTKFRKDFGGEAFKAHVAALETVAAPATKPSKAESFATAAGEAASEAAMKWQAKGADALERAITFSRQWTQLKAKGATRQSEERYIEVNMAGIVQA